MQDQKEIISNLKEIAQKVEEHDENNVMIIEYLNQLEQARQHQENQASRKRIGFRKEAED